ncbi:EVE domain-containing protein [Marinagarivorans algicola]|uniref:EVE domain-containing protein n=1 Tax=Marinagarivorans algicola TaxID=1513270 RepID=UPI0006B5EF9B|nr:EVE domain-containing protein [Marinagarivorans algicola]
MPRYWLFKTEPDEFSINDLRSQGTVCWDGVRNYSARNFLRDELEQGDRVLIYHSSCKTIGVAGIAQVTQAAYPDPTQFDSSSAYYDPKASRNSPKWFCVTLGFSACFGKVITLGQLKNTPALSAMTLFKQPRLSVQPVTADEFQCIKQLARIMTCVE